MGSSSKRTSGIRLALVLRQFNRIESTTERICVLAPQLLASSGPIVKQVAYVTFLKVNVQLFSSDRDYFCAVSNDRERLSNPYQTRDLCPNDSNQTRPSECETAVAACRSYCCRNQNPLGRIKDSRENSRVHCGINWHSTKRTVRSEVGRYQSFCRNDERGAFHRARLRGPVQD